MRSIGAEALAAMQSGRFGKRTLVYFDIPGGGAGFWDDGYDIVHGGDTYYGLGGAMTVSPMSSGADFAARAVDVAISGLDTRLAAEVEALAWHQTPVVISEAIIAVDAPQILYVAVWFSGIFDQLVRSETVGGVAQVTAKCESIAREFGRKGARTQSDADQRQIDADDGFYTYAATSGNTPINWGGRPEQPPPKKKFLGLF